MASFSVFSVLILFQYLIQSKAYSDIIDTTTSNEFYNKEIKCSGNGDCKITCDEENSCAAATITCPHYFLCDITCSGIGSCDTTEILCPYGESCTINCNNDRSCQSAIIRSQYSSQLTLNDCSDDLSCNGMSIYVPPNNNGYPRATINGGDNLKSINGRSLHFYAIFGWHDLNFINYNGNSGDNSNAFMHCLPSYSSICLLSTTSWTCAQSDDVCNTPPTQQPTASPTRSPTSIPTTYPTQIPTSDPITFEFFSTLHPTLIPTISPTQEPIAQMIKQTQSIMTTEEVIMNENEGTKKQTLDHVDILWLVMSLLLSVLCFVLVTLSFYVYNSKHDKHENIKANNDEHMKLSKKELKKIEHAQRDSNMNQLFIEAMTGNGNNKYPKAPIIEEEEFEGNDVQQSVNQKSNLYPNGSLNQLNKLRTTSIGAVSVSQSIAFWNNQQPKSQKLPQTINNNQRFNLPQIDSSNTAMPNRMSTSSALQLVLDHNSNDTDNNNEHKIEEHKDCDSESRPSHLVSFNLSTNCNKSANSATSTFLSATKSKGVLSPLSTVTASSMMEMSNDDDSGDETEEYENENSTDLVITGTDTTNSKRRDNEDGILKMSHFAMIQQELEQLRDEANSSDDPTSASSCSDESSTEECDECATDGQIKRMNDINVHLEDYRASMKNIQTEEEDEYVFDMYDHQRSVTMVINENKEHEHVNGNSSVTLADDNTPYESPFDNEVKNGGFMNGNVTKMFSAYLMNNPVSQHADDEDETETKSTRTMMTKDKHSHYHTTTHSTLEIQGLINV